MKAIKTVFVTGGAGYVGAVLVPKLLKNGYKVKVLDLFMYGDHVFDSCKNDPNLKQIKADLRDQNVLERELKNVDAVIHLACISNDPSYELNPELGKSINYDAFIPLLEISKKNKVKRFIYASSSSVYGVKSEPNVTEDLKLEPLTDYSKYKALCEDYMLKNLSDLHYGNDQNSMTGLILRPATVCGYSPRLRLDLTVNILTNHAVNKGEILVFGGGQKRPNIHIGDMTDLYVQALEYADEKIHKKIFNAGYENHTVDQIAKMVQNEIGKHVQIKHQPTDDNRSYHVSSEKIARELGFQTKHTIADAIKDLKIAFEKGQIPNSMNDPRFYNIKTMQMINLK